MSGTNILGPLITMGNIKAACDTLAKAYLPAYLADAARADGIAPASVHAPRSWRVAEDVRKWPSQQLPAVFCAVPGTARPPKRRGDGTYVATWTFTAAAIIAGRDDDDTQAQKSVYEAALRSLFLRQAGGLALPVESLVWTDSGDDELGQARGHDLSYVGTVSVDFTLEVRDVASTGGGYTSPPPNPLGDPGAYPTADTVTVNLTHKSD